MMRALIALWKDEKAPTAAEYAIMASLIAMAILTAVALIGTNLDATFDTLAALIPVR